jgi:hypothetical protein
MPDGCGCISTWRVFIPCETHAKTKEPPMQKQRRLEAALIGLREFVVDHGEMFDGGSDGYEAQALVEAADEALAA